MDQSVCNGIPYSETGYFSQLVLDFLAEHPHIRSFYSYSPLKADTDALVQAKKTQPRQREVLVQVLREQYAALDTPAAVQQHISLLEQPDTFTVCTAHQPNIFTGYLYFVYKILQAIRLAGDLQQQHPQYRFVPVYYMGSEDNDLDELGSIYLDGKTLTWATSQQGAVGRMRPEGLDALIGQVQQQLGYGVYAEELVQLLRKAYLEHDNIQQATLFLVNALFGRYGLVVLIPDHPLLKKQLVPVMKDELWHQTSHKLVGDTIQQLSRHYKVQANPREINLFYLTDQARERIVKEGEHWKVLHSSLTFTAAELEQELEAHPERFSPNVILRGLLQETILPNIAFIGGGGEIAYWLELQSLFAHYRVPYPMLVLRNSFLLVDALSKTRLQKLGLCIRHLFGKVDDVVNNFVRQHTNASLVLKKEYDIIEQLFDGLEEKARSIDVTLVASVAAERKRVMKSIGKVEHKFLRAEKKKFAWQIAQIEQLRLRLFPAGSLQERKENFMPWYIHEGPAFFDRILAHMQPLTDELRIIYEQ
ncbi:bacillithiol biosynthesis cysteine-adding enzyme BshC [Chitinophaga japonensis]|uniref:Putative cysteine ligase BshC n=1 Tax=Chitinophaga japonensis TaxID=104662 RepID=A0A562T095_CHIJA|nr:bacillithiol biosynthesis cysteine-adding enzyme BshC [Chitinophaga japonensis]TWI86902.1 bacillithiol biosynthesis cysteine-adding enzyme BshC [Chitinophaga japonensis]